MINGDIIYWIFTGIFCAIFATSGISNLIQMDWQLEVMRDLGYPDYFMTILGIAKTLGVVALLLPKTPLLKEWAYAGFAFDMIGVTMSHIFAGHSVLSLVLPVMFFCIGAVSYLLRPEERHLQQRSTNQNLHDQLPSRPA